MMGRARNYDSGINAKGNKRDPSLKKNSGGFSLENVGIALRKLLHLRFLWKSDVFKTTPDVEFKSTVMQISIEHLLDTTDGVRMHMHLPFIPFRIPTLNVMRFSIPLTIPTNDIGIFW